MVGFHSTVYHLNIFGECFRLLLWLVGETYSVGHQQQEIVALTAHLLITLGISF